VLKGRNVQSPVSKWWVEGEKKRGEGEWEEKREAGHVTAASSSSQNGVSAGMV